jgi:hypothetical protein
VASSSLTAMSFLRAMRSSLKFRVSEITSWYRHQKVVVA